MYIYFLCVSLINKYLHILVYVHVLIVLQLIEKIYCMNTYYICTFHITLYAYLEVSTSSFFFHLLDFLARDSDFWPGMGRVYFIPIFQKKNFSHS